MKTAIAYYSKHHGNTKKLLDAIKEYDPEVASSKHCTEIGRYQVKGFDTYGPFRLIGGLQKGHPDDSEIQGAVEFYKSLEQKS